MSARARLVVALLSPLMVASCRATAVAPAPSAGVGSQASDNQAGTDDPLVARLCAGRTGCRLRARRPLPGREASDLVELSLARASTDADASDCDGGEYWVVHGTKDSGVRLARDCDQQTGADELAHLNVAVDRDELRAEYLEQQSSDRCQGVRARFHTSPFLLTGETRYDGVRRGDVCRERNIVTTDWVDGKHTARWTQALCEAAGNPDEVSPPEQGAPLPRFVVDGVREPNAAGSCALFVDGASASGWMNAGPRPTAVRLRAAVINDRLFIDVDGTAATGAADATLVVVVARTTPGDGPNGDMGCATESERAVSTATLHLDSGRMESQGGSAPSLMISGRTATSIHIRSASVAGVGRVALSYRTSSGGRLDTARLGSGPRARDLPPIVGPFKATNHCMWRDGQLDLRLNTTSPNPILTLRQVF